MCDIRSLVFSHILDRRILSQQIPVQAGIVAAYVANILHAFISPLYGV